MKFQIISKSNIKDLVIIKIEGFSDFRGENFESFNNDEFNKIVPNWNFKNFVIDSFSKSKYGVIRGFHGDSKNWKLVECLSGCVFLNIIDTRENSESFNKSESFTLNENNKIQILIPPGCVNAHQCISDSCLFHYKLTESYVKQEDQITRKWNSKNIFWPINNPILSQRDL